jgi:hypothetical protein
MAIRISYYMGTILSSPFFSALLTSAGTIHLAKVVLVVGLVVTQITLLTVSFFDKVLAHVETNNVLITSTASSS